MTNRAADVEKAFYEAQQKRLLAGNKPGHETSPTDRALYHYEGKRDPVGVIHEALDFYRLFADMTLENDYPLMSALLIELKVRGPRDDSHLRFFQQGVIYMTLTARQRSYQASVMLEFSYHIGRIDTFDEYAMVSIKQWIKRSQYAFAEYIRNGEPGLTG